MLPVSANQKKSSEMDPNPNQTKQTYISTLHRKHPRISWVYCTFFRPVLLSKCFYASHPEPLGLQASLLCCAEDCVFVDQSQQRSELPPLLEFGLVLYWWYWCILTCTSIVHFFKSNWDVVPVSFTALPSSLFLSVCPPLAQSPIIALCPISLVSILLSLCLSLP